MMHGQAPVVIVVGRTRRQRRAAPPQQRELERGQPHEVGLVRDVDAPVQKGVVQRLEEVVRPLEDDEIEEGRRRSATGFEEGMQGGEMASRSAPGRR